MISDSLQRQLAARSRDRSFLIRGSLIIVAVAVVISFVTSHFFYSQSKRAAEIGNGVQLQVTEEQLISFIRFGVPFLTGENELNCLYLKEDWDRSAHLDVISGQLKATEASDNTESIQLWMQGLSSESPDTFIQKLEGLPADLKWRDEFIGDLFIQKEDHDRALEYYLAATDKDNHSNYSLRSAIALAHYNEDAPLLRELLGDPKFKNALAPEARIDYYSYLRDYPQLGLAILQSDASSWISPYLIPALFTALIWGLILNSFWVPSRERIVMSCLAFLLGVLSATLTLFAVVIQEDIRGFTWSRTDTDISQFLYFLAGVALREETVKLLCFIPLIGWLRKRNEPVEALILAGMVGLGFAVNENIGYFQRSPGDSLVSWIRLLTANPLHFALTGVAGFYLARMIQRKGHGMEEFLIAFIAVVFAHGVYNSVISIDAFIEYAPLSTILVAAIAYQYFDRLRDSMHTDRIHRRISPLGVFVLGSAVLTCLAMLTSAASQPMSIAFRDFASGVAAMIPLAFAFISRFRDL
ncbi:PrsW family intramembrane metalloprotease [Verrucomicrobiales bacterium BCK34]|nr:PrsW family intramembrane metalloprotease [Verrucomicrobiales bacterium BCK34]